MGYQLPGKSEVVGPNMSSYTKEATNLMGGVICKNPAVSEMKVWLGGNFLMRQSGRRKRETV